MPISHRRHSFLDAQIACDRWISAQGVVRRTETHVVEQDERLLPNGPRPPARGLVTVVLEGALRASVDGGTQTLERGAISVVDRRERFVTTGGCATTLEIEWAVSPGMVGRSTLATGALAAVDHAAARLRDAARADDFAPAATSLREALAAQGVALGGLDAALARGEDASEQRYVSALDATLSNLRESGCAAGWEHAAGMTRRTLTRRTHSFHRRYGLAGLANRTDWRAVRDHYRTVIGLILLTHPSATIASVAQALGYGASTALCHAFASLDLPSPNRVRALVG